MRRRWIRNASDELAVRNGCVFDERRAEKVAKFFRTFLRHSKGEWAGKPFELLDWQRDEIIYPLFGWIRPDGYRRFRRSYIEIPKKNGKSTLAAGLGLYMLIGDGEAGSHVFSAAADRDQASIVHGEAINLVDSSPELRKHVEINRSTRNIHYPSQRAFYRALSSTPTSKEGFDGHCCIIDELHIWRGRELWDALRYMGRGRRQSLIFVITTAGSEMLSVCREQHDYAEKILDGSFEDDRYFAYIRSVSREELEERGVDDRELWHKANPSMGITINEEEFGRDVEEAKNTPTAYASFLRYSFNVWATSVNRWLNVGKWRACRESYDESLLVGQRCFGGLDLASRLDTAAFSLIFPQPDGRYRLLIKYWLPQATADARRDTVPYQLWADQGLITLTPGDVTDYETIVQDVCELCRRFKVQEIGFDPWNAEGPTQDILRLTGVKRTEVRQTIGNMTYPAKELERLIVSGGIVQDGNAVLDWQIGNVDVYTDPNDNIRPIKPKHGDSRTIDGVVSTVMALDRALRAPKPAQGSLLIV